MTVFRDGRLEIVLAVKVVGDLGIEPSVRLREGVTVPCHTLRPVAHFHRALRCVWVITCVKKHRQQENPLK